MSSPFSEYWRFWGKYGYYFKCLVETIQKEKLRVKLILKIHLLRHNSITMPLFDYYNQLILKLFQAWFMFHD